MTLEIAEEKKEELNERAKKTTKEDTNHTQMLKML